MTNTETTQTTRTEQIKQNLEQRDDFAGQAYRTIRDNPKTSAAIATGVVAAAAGTTAFLLNRKNTIGTATGHASASDEISSEVRDLNEETMSNLKGRSSSLADSEIQTDTKVGSVAY